MYLAHLYAPRASQEDIHRHIHEVIDEVVRYLVSVHLNMYEPPEDVHVDIQTFPRRSTHHTT